MKTYFSLILLLLFSFYSFSQIDSLWYKDGVRDKGKIYIDSKKIPKELKPYLENMKFVPGQTIEYGQYNDNTWDKETKVSVNAFFISAIEVTNASYREFCNEKGKQYLPDTTVWRTKLAYNEPYVEFYFRHPAYNQYPVVGVSLEKAEAYCQWLTEKVKTILEEYPKIKDKLVINNFRIPSAWEWECAAHGGDQHAIYSFGSYLNYVGKHKRIEAYSNFGYIKDEFGYTVEGTNCIGDKHDITAPVFSYMPNGYGLYNMSGNVNEWTSSTYPESFIEKANKNPEKDNIGKYMTKGGGWKDGPYYIRISSRKFKNKKDAADDLGFRVVMSFLK